MSSCYWSDPEVLRALECDVVGDSPSALYSTVSTDTRTLLTDALYVALEGERFNGHDFLSAAADAGATGAVVRYVPEGAPEGLRYYLVRDTREALGRLARHYRRELSASVVAVVGSNGKTSTKEMLRTVLASRLRVHATEGNLNNQIGVPLTILATPREAEVVVVEAGTNEPGEIDALGKIIEPDVVVLTSIAEEHLEKLGSLEGVLEEETSIFRHVRPRGLAFVNVEPAAVRERAVRELAPHRVHTCGVHVEADYHVDGGEAGVRVLEDGSTEWSWGGIPASLPLPGTHQVGNALLTLAVATYFELPREASVAALKLLTPPKLRGEWTEIAGRRVLVDCYNANPASMIAAVEVLTRVPASGKRIAVVGTLREMGEASDAIHSRVAVELATRTGQGIDLLIATGAFAAAMTPYDTKLGDRLVRVEDPVEAYHAVADRIQEGDLILLKASRGEALERWLPLLESI